MEITITQALLTKGAKQGRPGTNLIPKGVVVHFVGNPGSSAQANRNYFENGSGGNGVSSQYIVGLNGEVLQCVPDNERAMHAGKSYGTAWNEMAKTNNGKYLGIECCHPDSTGKFNAVTTASLVWLVKKLCKDHGLDAAKDVFRHHDVAGKNCPAYYVKYANEWAELVKLFSAADEPGVVATPPVSHEPSAWAKASWGKAVAQKIFDGTNPTSPPTREQIAVVLDRLGLLG